MSMLFSDLQDEVKRRATKNQAGNQFNTAIKNTINTSLFRIAREANWKQLRRHDSFNTLATYTTGTISATNGLTTYTGSSLNWITAGVQVGRRLTIGGSNQRYTVTSITGENAFTTDYAYDGTTASGLTYVLFGQEIYNLPIQTGKEAIIWHEKLGYPYRMRYITEREFYSSAVNTLISYTPTHYHMWDSNMVLNQPLAASIVTAVSSSASDTTQVVTIFGTVSGYPDYDTITLTGTTQATSTKSFTKIDRVTKSDSTVGRVTLTSNTAGVTLVVIPAGDATNSAFYKKIKVFPLPDSVFPIYVDYYKMPYRLINDGDVHEFGQDFDEAIILLSTAKIKLESDIEEGEKFISLYQDEIRNLKGYNSDKLDWLPTLLRPGQGDYNSNRINRFLSYGQLGGGYGPQA